MVRKNEWSLDKMCLFVEVIKKNREDMIVFFREGFYVYGFFMEGNKGVRLWKFLELVFFGWKRESSFGKDRLCACCEGVGWERGVYGGFVR